jgi:hypothetical protein
VDQDATIIESRKREALYTYEGSRGYQPMLAVWAEMDVVLATVLETCEFNNLNVLKFLLSKETTLEGLLRMAGRKAPSSQVSR